MLEKSTQVQHVSLLGKQYLQILPQGNKIISSFKQQVQSNMLENVPIMLKPNNF